MAASLKYQEELAQSEDEEVGISEPVRKSAVPFDCSEAENLLRVEVEKWIKFKVLIAKDPTAKKLHDETIPAWKRLVELFRENYLSLKHLVPEAFQQIHRTIKRGFLWWSYNKYTTKVKNENGHTLTVIACLECLTVLLAAITNQFEQEGFSYEFYAPIQYDWSELFTKLYTHIAKVDSTVACAMLDAVAAAGYEMYGHLPEASQTQFITNLLGHGSNTELSTHVRAKIGRCLAKLIEFPHLRYDISFFMDVLDLTAANLAKGESLVKVSYAWTFGNLTDFLIDADSTAMRVIWKQDASTHFMDTLMETAMKCIEVPARARYSACRAWGNIFRWLQAGMIVKDVHRKTLDDIVLNLDHMVGTGLDYKLRWNAAHALGNALGNENVISALQSSTKNKVVRSLAKWSAQSQNYKERTQCVIALTNAKNRNIFGAETYEYVWDRICLSLSRLPVDECESADKFKIECVLLIIHLINLIRSEDLYNLYSLMTESIDLVKALFEEYVPSIPLLRLDEALSCRENLSQLLHKPEVTGVMRAAVMMFLELIDILYGDE